MTEARGTRFVVFTTNRSGSVWVMSTLNNHPHILAQGELFLPRPRVKEKRWDSEFAYPRFIEAKSDSLTLRPFSVFGYLNALYGSPGSVGFKLLYAQLGRYPEILAYLVWHRIRIVHLVRQNHLDVLLSYAIKARLGRAHLLSGQTVPDDLRVELATKDILGRLRRLQTKQRAARTLLGWCRLPHMEVAYEDLLQNPARFDEILDFLDVGASEHFPESSLVKIRRGGHRDVISNYDEVSEVLSGSNFAGLLD